jgi:hypothetical protein
MVELVNVTNTLKNVDWVNVIGGIPGVSDILVLGRAIGIALLIYVIFLIIRSVTQILYSLRFKKVAKNVEEINQKLDILVANVSSNKSKATKSKK